MPISALFMIKIAEFQVSNAFFAVGLALITRAGTGSKFSGSGRARALRLGIGSGSGNPN